MILNKDAIEIFEKTTRYPLTEYLNEYSDFIEDKSQNITNLYLGVLSEVDNEAFETLDMLFKKALKIESLIDVHKKEMTSNISYWELFEFLTDIKTSLLSFTKAKKWARSSVNKGVLSDGVTTELGLKRFQTLEDISRLTGANNQDDYWIKVALENDLSEEDYGEGTNVKLNIKGANRGALNIRSVIDSDIVGEKIYGKDIQRKLQFENDDLKVLSYKDTLFQTVSVLSTLKKGDTPEFIEEGIQSSIVSGSNRNAISYGILVRQYYETFGQDDSFKSILIKDIKLSQDSLSLTIECETRIGETIDQAINL
jgi:hypothetical protein